MRTVRGFTLIELLVVIAIVALLVSILLPALGASRRAAHAARCLAGLHNIGLGVASYCDDFDGHFPLSSHTSGSLYSPDGWLASLEPYGVPKAARFCPADPTREQKLTSYATNDHMEPLTAGIDYDPFSRATLPGGRTRAYDKLHMLPAPAAVAYAAETAADGTVDHLHSVGWTVPEQVREWIAVTRHLGASNYVYADGHAAAAMWVSIQQTFSDRTSFFNPETAR